MQVNYIQVAYVLGIPAKAAKIRIAPFVDRLEGIKLDRLVKYINKDDYVESSKLNAIYHHPSPDLNGKDQIAYIIQNLRGGVNPVLKKKIVEDISCLKSGKLSGKYSALNYILQENDIESINKLIKKRRLEFLGSGGSFPSRERNP